MTAVRPWCAVARYQGLQEFIGGTVVLPADAQSHEVIAALTAHFDQFLPPGFEVIRPVAGSLFFNGEAA